MRKVWVVIVPVAAMAAVTLALVISTPDTPVPVLSVNASASTEELRDALSTATALLADDPTISGAALASAVPLVDRVEGREPAGVPFALAGLLVSSLGVAIVTRAANRYGWYVLTFGGVSVALGLARALADLAVRRPWGPAAAIDLAFALGDTLWIPLGVLLGPMLLLRLPNGRLLSRRWAVGEVVAVFASLALLVQLGSPVRFDGRAVTAHAPLPSSSMDVVFRTGILVWQVALLIGIVAVVVRRRRAVGAERQQLRWIAFGLTVSALLLGCSDIAQRLGGDATIWGPVGAFGFAVVLPVCLAVAILRYHLFAIDLVMHRTLVFGLLSALVAIAYVAAIAVAGAVLGVGAAPAALLAMLLVAVAFEPLHWAVVAAVDRSVWRRPLGGGPALDALVRTVAEQTDLTRALRAVVRAVLDITAAAEVSVRGAEDDGRAVLSIAPDGASPCPLDEATMVVPVSERELLVVRSRPGDRVRRSERVTVRAIATLCGTLLDNTRTRADLDAVVAATDSHRQELLDAEARLHATMTRTRAAVERDLHDGAQARAVSLAATVGLARAAPGTVSTRTLLEAIAETERSIHAFAHGLHPVLLRERGLADALREQARSVLPTAEVDVQVGSLPQDVAAVTYLVAVEAMVNVAKHAQGAPATVRCTVERDDVVVTITDGGPGLPAAVLAGTHGLDTIRERVTAMGGRLRLESEVGSGTTVRAAIPVGA